MASLGACLVANDQKGIGDAMIQRRIDGVSWKDIADEFNLGSPGAARNYFKKVTGIEDFKAKGKALEQLVKEMAEGTVSTGTNTATKAVKAVKDAMTKPPAQLAEDVGLKGAANKSVQTLASELNVPESAVESIASMNASGQGYTAIKSTLSGQGHSLDFAQIDEVVWNDLLGKADGKVWEAYKKKPTSENGFNAVKKKVLDLHAKGLDYKDIAKIKEAPPESVVDAIIKDKWSMPPMGSTQPIIPPPPPPPPVVYTGKGLSGRNFTHRSHADMMEWINSYGYDLAAAEKSAVQRYTGSGYHEINEYLRKGTAPYGGSAPTRTVSSLSKAMRPLDKDTIVVRQVTGVEKVFKTTDLHETLGTVIHDKGFMSTTIKPDGTWSGDVKMHISVPKGHPSRYVGDISMHTTEKELILQRGTKMVVTKVQKLGSTTYGGDSWEMWVEVIGTI